MSSMSDFVSTHKSLMLGAGLVALVFVGSSYFKKKNSTQQQDLTGLTNGIVYVPTQTSFVTNNAGDFSNDPNLQTVTNSGNYSAPVTTTTTTQTTDNPKGIFHTRPPLRRPPPNSHPTSSPSGGLLGPNVRIFPNYKNGQTYYRGPQTGGKIIAVPLPKNTTYIPGANGRVWYKLGGVGPQLLLTSGEG